MVSRPPHAAGRVAWFMVCPGWVRCCALLIWAGTASLRARARGKPSSAHCAQRLSDGSPLARANPCAPAPEGGSPDFSPALQHAAQRAVTGWRGGLGRVGADLASAGSMRPPPSPAHHVSTARLATTKVRRETSASQQHTATPHHTSQARNSPHPHPACQRRPRAWINSDLLEYFSVQPILISACFAHTLRIRSFFQGVDNGFV